jgi:hypothetical protein
MYVGRVLENVATGRGRAKGEGGIWMTRFMDGWASWSIWNGSKQKA